MDETNIKIVSLSLVFFATLFSTTEFEGNIQYPNKTLYAT